MFFRTRESHSGRCLQLSESYRNEKGQPRHRVFVSIGGSVIEKGDRLVIARLVEQRLLGHQVDPDRNDSLTSKWLGLIRPHLAGLHRPLTVLWR